MNCKRKSGATSLIEVIPLGPISDTSQFYVDIVHFLCRNRRLCVNSQLPPSADLKYKAIGVQPLDNGYFSVTVQVSGTITYLPYACNCVDVCPVTESVFTSFNIPIKFNDCNPVIVITNSEELVNPTNVRECSSVTNAVEIENTITVFAKSCSNKPKAQPEPSK